MILDLLFPLPRLGVFWGFRSRKERICESFFLHLYDDKSGDLGVAQTEIESPVPTIALGS
jgi:hypothetical protein